MASVGVNIACKTLPCNSVQLGLPPQLLGIKAVPWIVRPDGALSDGMPPDLAAWLAAGARS